MLKGKFKFLTPEIVCVSHCLEHLTADTSNPNFY